MASSLCRISTSSVFFNIRIRRTVCFSALWTQNLTRMIFDEPPIFGCINLMTVCSSTLWIQNLTRMIFDKTPSLWMCGFDDVLSDYCDMGFWQTVCSSTLWIQNLTRMIFDKTPSLWMCGFDDVLSDYCDMGFWQTRLLNIYDKDY
ncbi:hypothetical protein RclHR1_01020028 [Rhizophagus clarus]|uniref:Uncharacterized protein n=1 Tax=Rhizophagus clarus TaxID=94130 RepID=A0A2Z6Q167_9GLOM|nr:hypothetical protein RclHR1_01020028 [Rhizophagus clarus]